MVCGSLISGGRGPICKLSELVSYTRIKLATKYEIMENMSLIGL